MNLAVDGCKWQKTHKESYKANNVPILRLNVYIPPSSVFSSHIKAMRFVFKSVTSVHYLISDVVYLYIHEPDGVFVCFPRPTRAQLESIFLHPF